MDGVNCFLLKFKYILYLGDEDIEITGPDYEEDPADLQLLQDVGK